MWSDVIWLGGAKLVTDDAGMLRGAAPIGEGLRDAYFVFQLQAVGIFAPYRDFFPCFANIAMFEDFQGCR